MGKIEFDKRKENEKWLYCNRCKKNTAHTILTGVDYSDTAYSEELGTVHYGENCDIVQCGGCKEITFAKASWDSESFDPRDKENFEQFPPKQNNNSWYLKDDVYGLPYLVREIYRETVQAINIQAYTLAAVGMRAIIEVLCKDKGIRLRGIATKIDKLVDKGFLTQSGADILHVIRDIGNDAAHDGTPPTAKEVDAAMKVIDHLLLGIYIIPEEADLTLSKRKKQSTQKRTTAKTTKKTTAKTKRKAKAKRATK